jgi:hypothetical protein
MLSLHLRLHILRDRVGRRTGTLSKCRGRQNKRDYQPTQDRTLHLDMPPSWKRDKHEKLKAGKRSEGLKNNDLSEN